MHMRKDDEIERLGICHRLFNFLMNTLIGRGLKRVSLGSRHAAMPTSQAADVGESAAVGDGVQEPLITSHACGDESDSVVEIHFKLTNHELENRTPIDKLGSLVHVAGGDLEKKNLSMDNSGKVIIPITDGAGKKKGRHKFGSPKLPTTQHDASTPMLTGLGLNINEISEKFIQNTRDRMTRNISLMEPEEN